MSSRLGPAVASGARHRDLARVLAFFAALVFFLQLPGPATCLKLAWRFTAVPLETAEAESDPRIEKPTAELEAATAALSGLPEGVGPSVIAWLVVPPAWLNAVLDGGTTRAPPSLA
jgi:hypothetical protein